MFYYVARPTNARSIAACREHGFGALLSPVSVMASGRVRDMSQHVWPRGLRYSLDNGAWAFRDRAEEWSDEPLVSLLRRLGLDDCGHVREGLGRGFVVLPDVVGDGSKSLARSLDYWERERNGVLGECVATTLLAVQDGHTPEQIGRVLERERIGGVFVGGSTLWKWQTAADWAELALDMPGIHLHVGRVNTLRATMLCRDLGVASCDGSSVSRFAVNAGKLARAHDGDDRPIAALLQHGNPTMQAHARPLVERARQTIRRSRSQTAFAFEGEASDR
jgi:hypothetical protein